MKFIDIFFIFIINIVSGKIFLQIENEESAFVEGLIKIRINQSSFFIQFKKLNILKTNEICYRLGYMNIHSIQSPFQIHKAIRYIVNLNLKTIDNFKM